MKNVFFFSSRNDRMDQLLRWLGSFSLPGSHTVSVPHAECFQIKATEIKGKYIASVSHLVKETQVKTMRTLKPFSYYPSI